MKNLTLRIDEKVLAEARKRAALKGTTVAKLVRGYLEKLAGGAADPAEQARQGLLDLSDRSVWGLGDWKWNREDIYAERFSRFKRDHLRGAGPARGFGEAPASEGFDRDD